MNIIPLQTYMVGLTMTDFLMGFLAILVVIAIGSFQKSRFEKKSPGTHNKYFMPNIYFHVFFALVYGFIYEYYYGGGDTTAYYKGAVSLLDLMDHSFRDYVDEMMMTPSQDKMMIHFDANIGYPPGWIYRDPSSFFICKLFSIVMYFIGQSYLVLSVFLGYLTAMASWRVLEIVRYYAITTDWLAALSILFIPSVAFWCAGVSKDTIILLAMFYILYHFFSLINGEQKSTVTSIFVILVYSIVLYKVRTFMIFTVIAPLLIALSTRVLRNYQDSKFLLNSMRIIILGLSFGGFMLFLRSQSETFALTANKYVEEASVQQQDFLHNESYGENRYDLGITSFTPFGMLSKAPAAVLTAFYRPGIWEARSVLLLVSGLETSLFIALTVLFFFKGNAIQKIRRIRQNEFLTFSIFFAIILAFFAGFTSGLFGVLVRFKAPLLPFLIIVLTTREEKYVEEEPAKKALNLTKFKFK